MYGIMVRNTGMWGCTTWCHHDGKIESYPTREEAQAVADKYNGENRINNFNHYFVRELKGEEK